jgi:hypothetical protein
MANGEARPTGHRWIVPAQAHQNNVQRTAWNPAMPLKLTRGRKQAFLAALRATGSIRAAARRASPGSRSAEGPRSTFRMALQRDPEFAAASQEALDDALGSLEAEAMRRAVEGYQRPIYQKGQLVGYETVFSDNMLLTLLRARAPEAYSERRDVHVTGTVSHLHGVLTIDVAEISLLDPADRDALMGILDRLASARGEGPDVPMIEADVHAG